VGLGYTCGWRRLGIELAGAFVLVTVVGVLAVMPLTVCATSVYVIANHHTAQFDAWNISVPGVDPPISYQATYNLSHAGDPAGVAVDSDSETLFITSESDPGVELVDAKTMTSLGWADGASNLAGIDIDQATDTVYAVERATNHIYVYDWDPVARTLTLKAGYPKDLPSCTGAFGLALDSSQGLLYVADTLGATVRVYDIATLAQVSFFTPSMPPMGIDVDTVRGFVYTTAPDGSCAGGSPGATLLSQYDVVTSVETTVDLGHGGMGVAVDEVTGRVYVTGGCSGDDISVWDSGLNLVYTTGVIGNPAGIAIGNVSYNPLNLAKNDTIVGRGVHVGQQFSYEITFDNADNAFDVTGVVAVDRLPAGLTFISETLDGVPGTGVYDPISHTVTWNIGTLVAGYAGSKIELVVQVSQTQSSGTTIYNYCEIESDQTPLTTVVGGDPDNPDEPGTDIIEGMPVALASDISGQPQTMYADTIYSVTCKYYHVGGRDALKHCLLQLDHPTKPLTMMWDQSTGIFGPWAGEEGANYLTVTNVDVTEIANGSEGYELTWSFKINGQWPDVDGVIDFGVFASDDFDQESGWDYDNAGSSFISAGVPEEILAAVERLRSDANDAINGIWEDMAEMWLDWCLDTTSLVFGYAAGEFINSYFPEQEIEVMRGLVWSLAKLDMGLAIYLLKEEIKGAIGDAIDFDEILRTGVEEPVADFLASFSVGPNADIDACVDYIDSLRNSVTFYELRYHSQIKAFYDLIDEIEREAGYAKLVGYGAMVGGAVVFAVSAPTGLGAAAGAAAFSAGQVIAATATGTQVITQSVDLIVATIASIEGGRNCRTIGDSIEWGLDRVADALVNGTDPRANARISYVGLPTSVANAEFVPVLVTFSNASDDAIQGRAWITQKYNYIGLNFPAFDIPSDIVNVPAKAQRNTSYPTILCGNVFDLLQVVVPVSLSTVTVSARGTYGFTSPVERTSNTLAEREIRVENPVIHWAKDAWVGFENWLGGLFPNSMGPASEDRRVMVVRILLMNNTESGVTVRVTDSIPSTIAPFMDDVDFITPYETLNAPAREVTWEVHLAPLSRTTIEYRVAAEGLASGELYILPSAEIEVLNAQSGGLLEEYTTPRIYKTVQDCALMIEGVTLQPQNPSLGESCTVTLDVSNPSAEVAASVFAEILPSNGAQIQGDNGRALGSLEPGASKQVSWTLTITSPTATIGFRVTSANADTVFAQSALDVNLPPTISLLYPTGGETLVAGSAYLVRWDAQDEDDEGESLAISIAVSRDGGTTWLAIAENEANDGSYDWVPRGLLPGSYRMRVTVEDAEGATASDTSGVFTLAIGQASLIVAPNPVEDDETAFLYSVPVNTSEALLRIFSVSGRELFVTKVDPLGYRWPAAGYWAPVDEYGVPLANGPYLCVVVADGRVVSQAKMVIRR